MSTDSKAAAPVQVNPSPDAMATLTAILQKLSEQPPQASGMTPAQMATMLTAARHPQNAAHPGISPFSHPEGDVAHPKPTLRPRANGDAGLVFFCGAREDPESLTPAQVDLYNRFTHTVTARAGRWRADVLPSGDLSVMVPCKTIDERMDLPSLDLILRELLDGQAAVDPVSLAARVAQLEAQLAAK